MPHESSTRYRSPSMLGAFLFAEQISSYSTLSCMLLCAPGPERLELAMAIANRREMCALPAGLVSPKLAQVCLLKYEHLLTQMLSANLGPPVLFIEDPQELPPDEQVFIGNLMRRASVILALEEHKRVQLHAMLQSSAGGNTICIPPLTDRREDVVSMALSWLGALRPQLAEKQISPEAWDILCARDWPNSQMLGAAVEAAATSANLAGAKRVELVHLPPEAIAASPHGWLDIPFGKEWTMQKLTDSYALHVRARLANRSRAAKLLGMTPNGLGLRLARLTGQGQDPDRRHRGTPKERPRMPLVTNPAERWANCGAHRQPDKGVSRPFSRKRMTREEVAAREETEE